MWQLLRSLRCDCATDNTPPSPTWNQLEEDIEPADADMPSGSSRRMESTTSDLVLAHRNFEVEPGSGVGPGRQVTRFTKLEIITTYILDKFFIELFDSAPTIVTSDLVFSRSYQYWDWSCENATCDLRSMI